MRSSRLEKLLVRGFSIIVGPAIVIANAAFIYCKYQPAGSDEPRIEQLDSGTVVFKAPIDDQTASDLIALLQHPRLPITRIGVSSGGGLTTYRFEAGPLTA